MGTAGSAAASRFSCCLAHEPACCSLAALVCPGTSGGSSQCARCAGTCGCRWAKQSAWRERQAQQREEQQRQAAASLQQLVASVDHLEERLHHSMQVRGSSAAEHRGLACRERACSRPGTLRGRNAIVCRHSSMQRCGAACTLRGRMLAFACTAACSCVAVMPRSRADRSARSAIGF